jgi:hypothetical protein
MVAPAMRFSDLLEEISLRQGAGLKNQVQLHLLVRLHADAIPAKDFESISLHSDLVQAGPDPNNPKFAVPTCLGLQLYAGLLIAELYICIGNGGATGIPDFPSQLRRLAQGQKRNEESVHSPHDALSWFVAMLSI